jgi:hypothetical protein
MAVECVASSASPSARIRLPLRRSGHNILVVGVSMLQVVQMVLVGVGDDCWSWWHAAPWSHGLFGLLLWLSALVSGARRASAGSRR